jgi:ATP-dependent Clp protease ATP-binding subunit ClpA
MRNHFTAGVKESISYSAEEAIRTKSPAINAAHLLLGLLRVHDEAMGRWRAGLGTQLAELAAVVETTIQTPGELLPAGRPKIMQLFRFGARPKPGRLPLDRGAERVIRLSPKEVAGHEDIEPRHLMLALLHDKDSMLAPVLERFAIDDSAFKDSR